MIKLAGKSLIITGASMGIGRAVALELADIGVHLVLNARHEEPLIEAAEQCKAAGVQASAVAGNAANGEVAEEIVAQALELGSFYGFIHAAGVLHPGPFLWELSPEDFQEVLDSHAGGAYQLVRLAVPHLLRLGGGLAVFFGSGAAVSNFPGMGAYAVAKAAEEHLARQVAAEAPEITSFIFRPDVTDTRMQAEAREAEGGAAEALRRHFQGYLERGELSSPEAQAEELVKILTGDPRQFQGKIA